MDAAIEPRAIHIRQRDTDGPSVAVEQLTAVRRAGADFVLTYFAREVAEVLGR